MNERLLLELYRQSGISVLWEYNGYDGHAAVCNFEDIEKLVELIVRECATVADDPDVDMLRVGDAIKQRFGVGV